jgi:hypothetical protein
MSTTPTLSEYLLLFRNNAWYHDLSPGEIEEAMKRFTAWFEKLNREGKYKSSAPLAAAGKTITSQHMVTDGPFRGIQGSSRRLLCGSGREPG